MQQQQQQQGQDNPLGDLRSQLNLAANAAQVLAAPAAPWATRLGTWGTHYVGGPVLLGCLAWPPVFAAFYGPHPRVGDVFDFWVFTVLLLFLQQAVAASRQRRGHKCHSRYAGDSWLEAGPGGRGGLPQRAARLADGLLVIGAGVAAAGCGSDPLASLLMLTGAAKLARDGLAFQAVDARVRQMEDARYESECYAALLRDRQ